MTMTTSTGSMGSTTQRTLARSFVCEGIGLHSGKISHMSVNPAASGHGLVFQRLDLDQQPFIPAHYSYVTNTFLCTQLSNGQGADVATTEHLMAALAAHNIHNALIKLDGSEVPFLDGSALPFMEQIAGAGIVDQKVPRLVIKVTQDVRVEEQDRWVQLTPAETFSAHLTYDFGNRQGLGKYSVDFQSETQDFQQCIAPARSFGFYQDAEKLYEKGLALGASLDNTVVIDQGQVMNPTGLRFEDEYARHKILDAVGDLYLAGAPLIGRYSSHNGGHGLHLKLLEKLFDHHCFVWIS